MVARCVMTKWSSANEYDAYYLNMCETLPELQSEWMPSPMHSFALTQLVGNTKIVNRYTISSVEVINEKAKCFNAGKISNINTKHRIGNPFRSKDGLSWVTYLPTLEWIMANLKPYYCNVKEQVVSLNEMCETHMDASLRLHRLEPLALHLYALRTSQVSWDYNLDMWVKMVSKAQWFKELKAIMVAKGHFSIDTDMTKVYFSNIWEEKFQYGVLIKNLRSMIQ